MTDCEKYIQALIEVTDELTYLKEAIETIQNKYELKQYDRLERGVAKACLHCIHEIHKQVELIKLREQGGKV